MRKYYTSHLVKSEDLNHHGTLFAARTAEWFVESAFMTAACEHGNTEEIVCRNIHGMSFTIPVQNGDIVRFESRIVHVGTTSMMVSVTVKSERTDNTAVEGFITFVTIDKDTGKKKAHGIVMDSEEDVEEQHTRDKAVEILKG